MTKKPDPETAKPQETLFKDRADLVAYLKYAVADAAAFNQGSATLLMMAISYLDDSVEHSPPAQVSCKLS